MTLHTLLVVVLADIVLYQRAALCITPADIMASNRVVYSLLPPGGRVVGAPHVCSDVLSLGVSQATQKACSAAFAVHRAEAIIEEGLSLLECSDGDDLDGWLSEIMVQACRELKTSGAGNFVAYTPHSVTAIPSDMRFATSVLEMFCDLALLTH